MSRNIDMKVKTGPNVPPLGGLDVAVYLLGALLSGGLALGLLVGLLEYWDQVTALVAPDALCTSGSFNWFLMLAALCFTGALCCISIEGLEHRYPIFGNPGFTYGGEDWDPIYPAMLRDKDAPPEVRKSVQDARFGLALWGLGLALSVVLCLFAVLGGTRLYPDGSIKTTVGFGEVTEVYAPEQIDRVILNVREPGRRRSDHRWKLELTFRTEDNKLITFSVHDFVTADGESEIDALRRLFGYYPAEALRFENEDALYKVFEWAGYDWEDQKYLKALFGVG